MIVIYKLTSEQYEGFTNKQVEYLKFNETYLNDKNMKLDMLYANYSGDEVTKDKWDNKTLDQCMDTCNKLENCIGFSRPIIDDKEYSTCYPRTNVEQCYSSRKGDFEQRQHSLGYNTFIKSNVTNAMTKCIGDVKLTLNKNIHIKSYANPNMYLGISTDGNLEVMNIQNTPQLIRNCTWIIITGLEGSGTVSLKNVVNNKFLYRDNKDNIILKELNQSSLTNDKQRASFFILDGLSNQIIFQCMPLDIEKTEKYISVYNKNNKYLHVISSNEIDTNSNKKTLKNMKLVTFELLDTIITSSITSTPSLPVKLYPKTPNQKIAEPMKNVSTPTKPLDLSINNFDYYNLFSGNNTDVNIKNNLQDNYSKKKVIDDDFLIKFTGAKLSNNLNDIVNNNKNYYDNLKKTNNEVENMIMKSNQEINTKSDSLVNKLNKMRIQEDASAYYFLKNLSNK